MVRLTEARVRDAAAPAAGRLELIDSDSGVRLRVTSTGARSFCVRRRLKGGPAVRITLGSYPTLSLSEAKRLARKVITNLLCGVDPRERMRADAVRGMTVSEALDGYLELRSTRLKASTAQAYRKLMGAELKPLADLSVRTLTADQVVRWHGRFASRSSADKAARLLRALLRYANDRHGLQAPDGKVATDALRSLRLWSPARRKTRTVADMPAWMNAVERCPEPVRDLFVCLAATGLRRDELRLATWAQVDLERGTLYLPDPKSRRPTLLPLPAQMREILMARRAAWRGATLVFSNDGVTPIGVKTLSRWIERTSAELGAKWSPHDLRRGYLSAAASLAPAYVVKRLAHHAFANADVTDGYVQLGVEELRPWAQRTADKVLAGGGRVVALAGRASGFVAGPAAAHEIAKREP
jgi:integrase